MTTATHSSALAVAWQKLWYHPITAAFVAASLFVFVWLGFAVAMVQWDTGLSPAVDMVVREMIPVLACVTVYKLVITRLGRFRKDDLGLRGVFADTAIGLGTGAALISAVVGIAMLAGVYGIAGWGSMVDALYIVVVAGISAAVIEEILLRGILFRWFEEAGGSFLALLVTSALVGAIQAFSPNAAPLFIASQAVIFGLLMGGAYMLTRSLWLPIGLHAGWNVTLALGWGEPVSGIQYEGLVISEYGGSDWLSGGIMGLGSSAIALGIGLLFAVWVTRKAAALGHWLPFGWERALRGR